MSKRMLVTIVFLILVGDTGAFDSSNARLLANQTNNQEHHHHDDFFDHPVNTTSILSLSMDLSLSICAHLERKGIRSLMRSCKFFLISCREFFHRVLLDKFVYLLKHNESKINIKHLLKTPLVDSIIMNASVMSLYFGKRNASIMSSKYIGIDSETGNGFISFWIKKVQIGLHQCRIITVLFNQTNIYRIFITDTFHSLSFLHPLGSYSLHYNSSELNDIKAINILMLAGYIKRILRNPDTWCLYEQWESGIFWLRVRNFCVHPFTATCLLVLAIVLFTEYCFKYQC